jgi:hypothetical protein
MASSSVNDNAQTSMMRRGENHFRLDSAARSVPTQTVALANAVSDEPVESASMLIHQDEAHRPRKGVAAGGIVQN